MKLLQQLLYRAHSSLPSDVLWATYRLAVNSRRVTDTQHDPERQDVRIAECCSIHTEYYIAVALGSRLALKMLLQSPPFETQEKQQPLDKQHECYHVLRLVSVNSLCLLERWTNGRRESSSSSKLLSRYTKLPDRVGSTINMLCRCI